MFTRRFPAFALALALPLGLMAPMALAEGPAVRLTVTGDGVSALAPDLATLTIGVTTTGTTAAEALAANSVALEPVLAQLRAAGVADRDLQTANLSVNPDWNNSKTSSGGSEITGFTAMNFVTVTIRKLDDLGPILDAAMADGANTLNGLSFGLANPRPALDAAREAAVEDAQSKAALLAAAVGQDLGRLVSISEGADYSTGGAPRYREAKGALSAVPVEAGELSYTASVTMVWELTE